MVKGIFALCKMESVEINCSEIQMSAAIRHCAISVLDKLYNRHSVMKFEVCDCHEETRGVAFFFFTLHESHVYIYKKK